MQRSAVVVVADKTSLKRPFIFANSVHMALCFFLLTMTVAYHRDILQTGKMVSTVSVVMLYVIEIGCLLLSVLGVFGAFKEKRWCFILYAAGMAAASQTIIVKAALSYQDIYELECCGLVEGYKDWGSSIPSSCNCQYPGKCIRLRGSATLGAPKNHYVYQEPCLPIYVSELKLAFSLSMGIQFGSGVFWVILLVMSIKLMDQIRRKQDFMALLESNRYVPGAF
ncbi:tetraspanin-8-like [Neolamprologus brichardi]|uniref:tetraspanin-8-like n=1 Tax=Neolamprologus brichardi TaxID=32507 RepID=UPI001643C312|nr:tetraspanin-8-like [Neolamprologus brichardi]